MRELSGERYTQSWRCLARATRIASRAVKRIQLSISIAAPVSTVFTKMIDPEDYRDWTSAFAEGSYFDGAWEAGKKIRFLAPNGDGMLGEIAELRPNEHISIRLIGQIDQGVEDTESEAVRAWAPAYERYTFTAEGQGTKLVVEQDTTEAYEKYMLEAWPKALGRLKSLCEAASSGTR